MAEEHVWRSEESAASLSKDPALFLSFTEKCPSSSANRCPFLFPFLHSILYMYVCVCGKKGYKAKGFFFQVLTLLCICQGLCGE